MEGKGGGTREGRRLELLQTASSSNALNVICLTVEYGRNKRRERTRTPTDGVILKLSVCLYSKVLKYLIF